MKIVNIKQKICVVRRTQNIYYIPQSGQFLKKKLKTCTVTVFHGYQI